MFPNIAETKSLQILDKTEDAIEKLGQRSSITRKRCEELLFFCNYLRDVIGDKVKSSHNGASAKQLACETLLMAYTDPKQFYYVFGVEKRDVNMDWPAISDAELESIFHMTKDMVDEYV